VRSVFTSASGTESENVVWIGPTLFVLALNDNFVLCSWIQAVENEIAHISKRAAAVAGVCVCRRILAGIGDGRDDVGPVGGVGIVLVACLSRAMAGYLVAVIRSRLMLKRWFLKRK